MKGPYYSNSRVQNVLLNASDISTFINGIRDTLIFNFWTQVSSFTTTFSSVTYPGYILRTKGTPLNQNRCCIKIWFNNDSTGRYPAVRFDISDENQNNSQLLGFCSMSSDHGLKTLRMICNPYQFFVFIDTTIPPNSFYVGAFNVNNVMGGVPHVNNPLHSQVFWGLGETGHFGTFRDILTGGITGDPYAFLINGHKPGDIDGNTRDTAPMLLCQRGSELNSPILHASGNMSVIEPYLCMGRFPHNVYFVSLWDAIVCGYPVTSKITSVADGKRWESFTLNTDVGSLFLVTANLTGVSVGAFTY